MDSVCYTGTHDNVTLKQWFDEAAPEDVACAKAYLGLNREEGYICLLYTSRNNHQNSAPKIVEYAELSKKKKFQLHFWIKCAMMLTWKRWNRFQTTIRLCRNENRRKHK